MKNPEDRGRPSRQAGILCVSSTRAAELVKLLRAAGYDAWSAPSLEEDPLPSLVPDLVLLDTPADYLADLAKALWPQAAVLRSKKGDSTSQLLRYVESTLKK